MASACPDPEALALLAQTGEGPEGLPAHLAACPDCREAVAALLKTPKASRKALPWKGLVAAAGLLLAVILMRYPGEKAPVEAAPPGGDSLHVLAPGAVAREPGTFWIAPGSLVRLESGGVSVGRDRGLHLDAGAVTVEHAMPGTLALVTPAGVVSGHGPWAARVACQEAVEIALWMRRAEAAGIPMLRVEVLEGVLEVTREGGERLTVAAGERLMLASGGPVVREAMPTRPEGLMDLDSALPEAPLPAWVLEVGVRLDAPEARFGIAFPTPKGLRLWQLTARDCAPGALRTVRLAVLGSRVVGGVDGRVLWSLEDAGTALEPAPGQAGLRTWGPVAVASVRVRRP